MTEKQNLAQSETIAVMSEKLKNIEEVRLKNIESSLQGITNKIDSFSFLRVDDAERYYVRQDEFKTIKNLIMAIVLGLISEAVYVVIHSAGGK